MQDLISPEDEAAKLARFLRGFNWHKVHNISHYWRCSKCPNAGQSIKQQIAPLASGSKCKECGKGKLTTLNVCNDCGSDMRDCGGGCYQCTCGSRIW